MTNEELRSYAETLIREHGICGETDDFLSGEDENKVYGLISEAVVTVCWPERGLL